MKAAYPVPAGGARPAGAGVGLTSHTDAVLIKLIPPKDIAGLHRR
jgi:hypothetical protein